MAPPSGNVSRPGRALAGLAALIVVLLLAIVGGNIGSPGQWGKDFKVHLGLDLTSGTTVALRATAPKGVSTAQFASDMTTAKNIMANRVNGAGFTEAQVQQQGSDIINVAVPGAGSQRVVNLVGTTAQLLFRQVVLIASNTGATTPITTPVPTPSASGSSSATPSSSASPTASASASSSAKKGALGSGAASGAGAKEMASRSHGLTVAHAKASATPSASGSATPSASASASPSATSGSGLSTVAGASGDASLVSASVKAQFNKLNCADKNWKTQVGYTAQQYNNPKVQTVSCGSQGGIRYKYVLDKAHVLGKDIKSASATQSTTTVDWQTNLNFDSAGGAAFGSITEQMFSKYGVNSVQDQLAVVLDGSVISNPVIQGAITGGSAQITGSFTQAQATNLANVLNYGALPLTFTKESVQSISPSLGSNQLRAGLIAGAIGLLLVVLYCLLYYRGLALVAVSSLIIAAALVFEAVILLGKYQGFALQLSGVAGLIVAIGITADSFVVFFERLRDEVREGRTLRTAVERGWKRARRTVLVSDTVSFLAAALLWYFSLGEVKGFAFTLGLTTVIDVVVVFLFTKPMVTLLARTKFFGQGHRFSGLDPARLGARAPWRSSRTTRVPARTPAKEA
ncbi:MAG: preprotein translocase subunit SecD [Streptosporangiaceae bacterium]|nr:preprotein translocase subunit SecD [Streptosporangiaceae bacterium]